MSDEYLLVDGYNIIFGWADLSAIAKTSLEDAREKLINILANYQGVKKMNLILVFDAHLVKGNIGSLEKHGDIYVVYTKEAETADNYIERTTTELQKGYKVTVATSDGLEQVIIMSRGAVRMTANELKEDVKLVNKVLKEKIEEIKPIKNNMLLDNLDPAAQQWMENLRRKK